MISKKKIKSIFFYALYALSALVFFVILFVNLSPQFGSNPTANQQKYYDTFANFIDGEFQNLEETPMFTEDISAWEFLKEEMVSSGKSVENNSNKKPSKDIIPHKIDYTLFKNLNANNYKIAWLGHSAFILNIEGKIILLDPMLGSHAAPVPIPSLK